jgi:UDP-N-acetylglucosamine--N-acetylmuramyl-(pentapeptide) pyrophosphoryl-undecaprenol N-acetylglucosamine transferase
MKIVFTGGGTAGHIFPIIAVIRELRKAHPGQNFEFYYIGPRDQFIKSLLSQESVVVKTIIAGKIRRYFSFQNIIDIFKIPVGFVQAFIHVFTISPDMIFSKGGYGSMPAVIAGWLLWAPIFLHESDISPGLANRIASRMAMEIFTAFPAEKVEYFPRRKLISVGNPLRAEILEGTAEQGIKIFNLTREKPVILILGGSQGAQQINDVVLAILPALLESFEVIHQTGQANFSDIQKEIGVILSDDLKKYYHPAPFLHDNELPHAYQSADLIISRAGAGSIFEIAAVGKPSVLVPIHQSAQDHQMKNAYTYAEKGAAIIMGEENFKPHFLLERLKFLFSQPEKLQEMSIKAKEFSKPQAARIIAEYFFAYLNQ